MHACSPALQPLKKIWPCLDKQGLFANLRKTPGKSAKSKAPFNLVYNMTSFTDLKL